MNPIDELKQHLGMNLEMGGGNPFRKPLVSPRVEDYRPQVPFSQKVIDKTIRPVANTAVDYGKLMVGAYAPLPTMVGSFAARKMGNNNLAEKLAQKSIDIRKSAGYGMGGKEDSRKAVKTTTDALLTTYGVASIPKMVSGGIKALGTPTVKKAVVEAVANPRQVLPKVGQAIDNFVTQNGRDFFLKGRTPTYELGMPTRIFRR